MTGRNHLNLDLASALASGYDEDDFQAVQPDAHGSMSMLELHHVGGFLTGMADPSPDGTGQTLLYGYKGPDGFALPLNDPRLQSKLPRLKPNESYQYGPTGNGVRCHDTGAISLITTDQGPQQQSVYFTVRPDAFRQVSPWGSIQFDANGYHLKHVSQARIDLGAIGGLPAPLDALSSYATISAATVNIQGTMVALGAAAGIPEPAAKGNTTVLLFQALAGVLTQLADPNAFTAPSSGGPCVPSADLLAAIAAASSAIAAGALLLPATSVTVT